MLHIETQAPQEKPSAARGWGRRWLQAARASGRVGKVGRGKVAGEVRFQVDIFDHLQWRRALAAVRAQPLLAARLLAGEVPSELESMFTESGMSLLPSHDLEVHCSCGSDELACAHLVTACHEIAARLDADPFPLFTLRGRTRAQLLDVLRPGGPAAPSEAFQALDARHFYGDASSLQGLVFGGGLPPSPAAVLTRLGSPSADCPDHLFVEALTPAYAAVAAQAARIVGE